MTNSTLAALDPPIVVEPQSEVRASVIWLHGLGADGHDFEPIVAQLSEPLRAHVRFVFPHAPTMPVTINGGAEMRAWYDIKGTDLDRRADADGIQFSSNILHAMLDAELEAGIAPQRVVAAGFSQGGAIALHAGLRYAHRLAGVMALSTYLPFGEELGDERQAINNDTPIFLGHGSQDPVVPLELCERSRLRLRELRYRVETHTYPMPHSVCAEELRDLDDWLTRVLLDD